MTRETNKNGPSAKKAKFDTQLGFEHVVAAIPSGNVASEPETGTLQKHAISIHAIVFVLGSVERHAEESVRCQESRPGNAGLVVDRPRLPCNFSEEEDEHAMHNDYHEYQRDDEEEIAWQHHLNNCIDDQLMVDVARVVVDEAKAIAQENGADVPEFIKVKRKGKGEASKWLEGPKPGMVF